MLNLPCTQHAIINTCRLRIELNVQHLQHGPELICLPPDGPQGLRDLLRHRIACLMHHLNTINIEGLSVEPDLLRPLRIALPKMRSSEGDP